MRKIAFINQKGGVGKTTTCVTLGAALAELGKRVLIVDMDPQANASIAFGVAVQELDKTLYEVITHKCPGRDAIISIKPNLDLLPSNVDLAGAEVELVTQIGREHALKEGLSDVSGYDFVLVDCPPSLGILNINALAYVDEVFVPLQCEFFALQGIGLLLNTLELVQKRINPALQLGGVIACMYDSRKSLSDEVVSEISKHFGDKVFATRIRSNVRLAEAPSFGQTVLDYAPDSNGAEDYRALAKEVAGTASANALQEKLVAQKKQADKQPHHTKPQKKQADVPLTPVASMPPVGKDLAPSAGKKEIKKSSGTSVQAPVEKKAGPSGAKKAEPAAPGGGQAVVAPKASLSTAKPAPTVAAQVKPAATVKPVVSVAAQAEAKGAAPVVQARKRGRPPKNPEVYNSIAVAETPPAVEQKTRPVLVQEKPVLTKEQAVATHNRITVVSARPPLKTAKKSAESATILAGEIKSVESKGQTIQPATAKTPAAQSQAAPVRQDSPKQRQIAPVQANLRPGRKKRGV